MTDEFDEHLDEQLTQLFALARSPGTAAELSLEAHVVGAMASIATEPSLVTALDQRRRMAASKAGVRAAIVVAALLVGTSTAAATGNLPDAAQSAVARATAHVGIDLPDPNDHHEPSSASTTPSGPPVTEPGSRPFTAAVTVPADQQATAATPAPQPMASAAETVPATEPGVQKPSTAEPHEPGPDLDGPAKKGLCQAWASHGENSQAEEHSTAMARLAAAAVAAGQTVEEFCAPIEPTPTADVPTTDQAPKNVPANDNKPPAGQPPTDKGPTVKGPTDKGPTDKGPTDKAPIDKAPKGSHDEETD